MSPAETRLIGCAIVSLVLTNMTAVSMLILLCFTIFGIILGSFSNSLVHRLPRKMLEEYNAAAREELDLPALPTNPVLRSARSHCPHCSAQLAWYDNIPLVSWLVLKAKCRHCSAPIPARYFVQEVAGGVIGLVCALSFGLSWQGAALFAAAFLLMWLVVIDFEHMLLPESLNYSLLGVGIAAGATGLFVTPEKALWGMMAGYLALCIPALIFKKIRGVAGVGEGDWLLLAALGAFVGPMAIIPVLLLGSLASISGHVAVGAKRETQLPFGPALALGGIATFVWMRLPDYHPEMLRPFLT